MKLSKHVRHIPPPTVGQVLHPNAATWNLLIALGVCCHTVRCWRRFDFSGVRVAGEPVWSYPVSAQFPANREINSEFPLLLGNQRQVRRRSSRLFNVLSGISLMSGTGIFFEQIRVFSRPSRERWLRYNQSCPCVRRSQDVPPRMGGSSCSPTAWKPFSHPIFCCRHVPLGARPRGGRRSLLAQPDPAASRARQTTGQLHPRRHERRRRRPRLGAGCSNRLFCDRDVTSSSTISELRP